MYQNYISISLIFISILLRLIISYQLLKVKTTSDTACYLELLSRNAIRKRSFSSLFFLSDTENVKPNLQNIFFRKYTFTNWYYYLRVFLCNFGYDAITCFVCGYLFQHLFPSFDNKNVSFLLLFFAISFSFPLNYIKPRLSSVGNRSFSIIFSGFLFILFILENKLSLPFSSNFLNLSDNLILTIVISLLSGLIGFLAICSSIFVSQFLFFILVCVALLNIYSISLVSSLPVGILIFFIVIPNISLAHFKFKFKHFDWYLKNQLTYLKRPIIKDVYKKSRLINKFYNNYIKKTIPIGIRARANYSFIFSFSCIFIIFFYGLLNKDIITTNYFLIDKLIIKSFLLFLAIIVGSFFIEYIRNLNIFGESYRYIQHGIFFACLPLTILSYKSILIYENLFIIFIVFSFVFTLVYIFNFIKSVREKDITSNLIPFLDKNSDDIFNCYLKAKSLNQNEFPLVQCVHEKEASLLFYLICRFFPQFYNVSEPIAYKFITQYKNSFVNHSMKSDYFEYGYPTIKLMEKRRAKFLICKDIDFNKYYLNDKSFKKLYHSNQHYLYEISSNKNLIFDE